MIIISAFYTKATCQWHVFKKLDRCPKKHPSWLQKLVGEQNFSSTVHVSYQLNETEKNFSVFVCVNKFRFKFLFSLYCSVTPGAKFWSCAEQKNSITDEE